MKIARLATERYVFFFVYDANRKNWRWQQLVNFRFWSELQWQRLNEHGALTTVKKLQDGRKVFGALSLIQLWGLSPPSFSSIVSLSSLEAWGYHWYHRGKNWHNKWHCPYMNLKVFLVEVKVHPYYVLKDDLAMFTHTVSLLKQHFTTEIRESP